MSESVVLVRCRLDGSEERPSRVLRYVPAAEFALWRYLMENRHGRRVTAPEVAVWVPDREGVGPEVDVDALEPVLRLEFETPHDGTMVPVRRFLAAETYPEARRALLSHFDPQCRWKVAATAGYFVPRPARRVPSPAEADTLPRFEPLEPASLRR